MNFWKVVNFVVRSKVETYERSKDGTFFSSLTFHKKIIAK
jgi:hypothetical protein